MSETGDVTRIVHGPYPIQRPYTPLFISLREKCNSLIDGMEPSRPKVLPPPDGQLVAEERETNDPGLIIATIDWNDARLASGPVRAEARRARD